MSDSKELVRKFLTELWEGRDLDAVDRYVAPGFVDHTTSPPLAPGRDGFKADAAETLEIMADIRLTVWQMLADGDRVAVHLTSASRDAGKPMEGLPPTDKILRLTGTEIYRIEDGRIAERWVYNDALQVLQQEGVIPPLREVARQQVEAAKKLQEKPSATGCGSVFAVAGLAVLGLRRFRA